MNVRSKWDKKNSHLQPSIEVGIIVISLIFNRHLLLVCMEYGVSVVLECQQYRLWSMYKESTFSPRSGIDVGLLP